MEGFVISTYIDIERGRRPDDKERRNAAIGR